MPLTLLAPVVGLLYVPPKPAIESELSAGRILTDVELNRLATSWWAAADLDPCIVTNVERSRGQFSAPRERWEAAGFVPPAKPAPVEEEAPDATDAPKKRGPGRPRKTQTEGADATKKRGPRVSDPDGAGRGKQQSNKPFRWTALIDALADALGTTHAALVADWVEAGALALLASLPEEARERVQAETEAAVAARRKELQDAAAPEPSDGAPASDENASPDTAPAEEVPVSDEATPEPIPAEAPPEPTPTPEQEQEPDTNVIAAAGVDVPPPPPAPGPSPRKAPKGKGKK